MVVNPAGPVPIWDGQVPRTVTVRASVGVTGGQLVVFSGANNAVSSGADSYVTNDIVVSALASGALFNGIVVTPGNTASGTNNYVTVAQNGAWIVTAAGTILAGEQVCANGGDAVVAAPLTAVGSANWPIGRAQTPAGSEGYTVVSFFG